MSEVRVSKDYIGDPYITIKLQGLRYVARQKERNELTSEEYHLLFYGYKGQDRIQKYSNKEECDEMYNTVSLALTKPNKEV